MEKAIKATQQTFESLSSRTPQYLTWHKLFKKEFIAFLKESGITEVSIEKPNHFDISGFFRKEQRVFYFRIEDLRWDKRDMLIRTAKDFNDYTGRNNQFVSLKNPKSFKNELNSIINRKD